MGKFHNNSKSLALLWMNLKAKLYILKNPKFLLLDPSSFELWFESYLSITVRSLSFLEIAIQSPFVYLSPSSSVSLRAPLPPHWPAMCAAAANPAPLCARPWALSGSAAAFPDPALATPALSTSHLPPARAALHRRSPLLQSSATSCFLVTPRVALQPAAAAALPAVLFFARHATPTSARTTPWLPYTPPAASSGFRATPS
jgi:hypothetical protein